MDANPSQFLLDSYLNYARSTMKYTRITSILLGLVLLLWQVSVQSAGTAQTAPWRFITINAPMVKL